VRSGKFNIQLTPNARVALSGRSGCGASIAATVPPAATWSPGAAAGVTLPPHGAAISWCGAMSTVHRSQGSSVALLERLVLAG
jgi:hypothetical protein